MFDVGFAEILLLSLVGLLVLGPERLPRVARTLGGMARKARSSWMSLKRSIEAEMRAEELKEPLRRFEKEIKSTVDDVKSGITTIRNFDPANPESAEKPAAQPAGQTGGNDGVDKP
jgi:sec-independent protein translocase protein TatB